MRIIHIASDHAGFDMKNELKAFLSEKGFQVIDDGTNAGESCDYPDFAHKLCTAVLQESSTGILVCGTGMGMSMAANRHSGIRAALCATELHARLSRQHNNANILCLGSRMTGIELAHAIVTAFLETPFEGGRHQRRIDKIEI